MSKDTSASDSEKSLESWNQSVIKVRLEYSARLKSAHRTSASGSLSWPTIRASKYKDTGPIGSKSHDHMLGKGYLCAVVTQDAANWPTPAVMDTTGGSYKTEWIDGRAVSYHNHKEENPVAYGAKLSDAVKYGLPAPANPSTDGSRQGSSVDWRTPQANEAGARVETLYTKDGQPARPGERAYRKTPDGRMVLQSQTINQQVEMVQNWATPQAHDAQGPKTPEQIAAMRAKGHGVKNLNEMVTWPTPSASCDQGGPSGLAGGSGNRKKLNSMLSREEAKAMGCGKLNPRWVETLMGLPVGWVMPSCASPVTIEPTSYDYSATESCLPQPSELLES
jgi:hypothetical protein